MAQVGHPDEPAIVAAFLRQFLADRERGEEHELSHYQLRYAGHEALIAAEYERLRREAAETDDGGRPATRDGDSDLISGAVADRYRDQDEIAAGGMGTIYRVFDPLLQRSIAKKVIGSRRQGRGSTVGLVERFLDEARVTAQLDHPGIVPVHELGIDATGRVYFTMGLVRGRNLSEIFDLVRAGSEGWTRTRALGVLQRVCEAMAFAHSKGVVHRDLKPANIMVGPFGQTYVLDWGLARVDPAVVSASGTGDGTAVRSRRHPGTELEPALPDLTHAGDVVGTPSYMAPEQASGDVGAIGPHSDVYAIGAMLYHLLAGRMPYADKPNTTWREVLDATRAGPPAPLPAVAREVPDELVAIQERAMARQPRDRYASAADLGEDLRAFLENRVVRAHRTGALAEFKKWVGRNRLAASAAALALVSLVAGLGASLWLKGIADDNAARAVRQTETQQAVLDFFNKDLLAAVAPGAVGKDATMRQVLDRAEQRIEGRFPDRPLVEAAVRRTLGDTYRRLGEYGEAERHALRSVELYVAHGGGDAALTLDARRVLAIVYSRQSRHADAVRENREILAISGTAFGDEHDDTLTAANNLGLELTYLGRYEEAEPLLRDVYEVRRRKLGADHDNTLVSMSNLGLLYYSAGRFTLAEPLIKGELDLCTKKHGAEDPGTLVSMHNWANLLRATGRSDEAIAWHERVFQISEKVLGPRHSRTLEPALARAQILVDLGRHDQVRALLALVRERAGDLEPDERVPLELALLDARLLAAEGEPAAAVAATDEVLARHRRILGDRSQRTLEVWRHSASALRGAGRPKDALARIDAALAANGGNVASESARSRLLRGRLLADLGRLDEAETDLLDAESYFAAETQRGPDRGQVIEALIDVYLRSGRPADAEAWRRRLQ